MAMAGRNLFTIMKAISIQTFMPAGEACGATRAPPFQINSPNRSSAITQVSPTCCR